MNEEWLQSILGTPNVPKIPEAEPISFILGTAPRVVIRIIAGVQDLKKILRTVHGIGSRLFLSLGTELRAQVCSICCPAAPLQGLRAEIHPGPLTWTVTGGSGCYPGVRFCGPRGEGQGQRYLRPTGRHESRGSASWSVCPRLGSPPRSFSLRRWSLVFWPWDTKAQPWP